MQMNHADIEAISPAADDFATAASRCRKPLGSLRIEEEPALAWRCRR